jgi:CRP/FNR family transcriptional regulator, cyclic AMP receptor protein
MLRMSGCERSSATRPRVPILSEHGWLARTPYDFRQAVLERLTIRKLSSGEALYRAGDREGGLWAIVEGGVQFEIPGPQLAPSLTLMAIPGFWFGEAPLISRSARQINCYAAQASVFATIPLADCRAILDEDSARWQWIALLASMNRDLAMGLAADLLLHQPRQRVIATLLRLSGWRTGPHLTPNAGAVHLSQQQLGQIANLSRTVVSSILGDLERRGLIAVGYRMFEVLDGEGLRGMLGDD